MNKINILDSSIFNRIAAGEVVEKPYSVVKELLDNSIDAGATKITIELKNGGIDEIKVSDNGCGIEPDDFSRVFLPHSTSKIRTLEDLDKIGTLGFRGEALASISSVSKVKLQSKTKENELGKEMLIEGGAVRYENEIGFDNGTNITVSKIFFNVPARAKFLRKPRQETSDITNLVARYILANPFISFRYIVDGKEVYFSSGNGLEDAIFVVYGKDCLNSLIPLDYTSANGIKVGGYIGNTTFSKPNRTYQTLIINGRYVINSMVSLCVYNCYEHYLMKGQFPFYIINLNIPLDKLDVNVHPNKLDVRFENNNEIYGVVYTAVSEALNSSNSINEINKPVFEYKTVESGISFNPDRSYTEPKIVIVGENNDKETNVTNGNVVQNNFTENVSKPLENTDNFSTMQSTMQTEENTENKSSKTLAMDFFTSLKQNDNLSMHSGSTLMNNVFDRVNNQVNDDVIKLKQDSMFKNNIKFVGTLFNTYLLVQIENKVYIIDQHAGHERLLFDKLVKEVENNTLSKQYLLLPYVINVNALEQSFLEQHIEDFAKMGFEIEPFGELCFRCNSIPSLLKDASLNEVFSGILGEISVFKNTKQSELILTKLMQSACKHAVKAGDTLSEDSVNSLLNQMKQEQMLLQCPHGRPVIIELTKNELEKWFKRIV